MIPMCSLVCLGVEARDVVKLWFVATFGSDGHLTRWPTEIVADYRDKTGGRKLGIDYPLKVVREKAIEAFPVLAKWGQERNGWAKLMWEESVAMFFTMRDLMTKHSIPSLSIHDSIIVPLSGRTIAEQTLSDRYQWVTRVRPKLVVHGGSLAKNAPAPSPELRQVMLGIATLLRKPASNLRDLIETKKDNLPRVFGWEPEQRQNISEEDKPEEEQDRFFP